MDTIPGADTLGFGFNILRTYDKSSTTSALFKSGKADDRQQTIGTKIYLLPENIGFEPDRNKKADSQVYSTRQQVQDHFSVKAGITGSGMGFKGHFDMSYSKVTTSDKSYYYALVEAFDDSYSLKLRNQGASWLEGDFAEEINSLPNTFSKENQDIFFSIFEKYGTHYVHQLQLGGHLYYYVAIEKSFSSDETTIKTNITAEYKGVFAKVKAEADTSWNHLTKEWAKSRVVSLHAQGGEASIFDSMEPGFGEWKGDSFVAWNQSLASNPGVTGFNLRPIGTLVPAAKGKAVNKAITEYLKGGITVSADRDSTQATTSQRYTSYPTIIGTQGVIEPTAAPKPEKPEIDIAGIQIVIFEAETYKVLQNRTHYITSVEPAQKMYDDVIADINKISAPDYFCAVSVFGLQSIYYPPPEITRWLTLCGAQLTGWKKYVGATMAVGVICYTFVGRKGSKVGVQEDFRIDPTKQVKKLTSTSLYFLYGDGLMKKATA